jgi:hypothetical protein
MAYITFNDGAAAQLDNGLRAVAAGVGSRFASWIPTSIPVGAAATALGTGARVFWQFRTDYGATFEVQNIPLASVAIADRLRAHLLRGGTCAVYTEDAAARTYTTCGIFPESTPELSLTDGGLFLYSLSLSLINLAPSPVAMRCEYPE